MLKKIKTWFKNWCRKHIVDKCPPELEDVEFSDKYR